MEFAEHCAELILRARLEPFVATNAEQAKLLLRQHDIHVALIDLMLPPTFTDEGVDLLRSLRQKYPQTKAVLMTQKQTGAVTPVAEAMRAGAHTFLDKNEPHFDDKLLAHLEEIMSENSDRVFVSFGHNELLKLKLKDFLQNRLQLNTVLLSDLPGRGLTIVEQLERVSATCRRAVILLTRDDEVEGGGRRARQNVVHEVGFFQGKYGRENVVLLAEHGVELFTNITGIKIVEFDPSHFEAVFEPLRAELGG